MLPIFRSMCLSGISVNRVGSKLGVSVSPEEIAAKLAKIVAIILPSVTYIVIDVDGGAQNPIYFDTMVGSDVPVMKKLSQATGEWKYLEMQALEHRQT